MQGCQGFRMVFLACFSRGVIELYVGLLSVVLTGLGRDVQGLCTGL